MELNQNMKQVTVAVGESADLICSADVTPRFCTFTDPQGTVFNLGKGANYENGRITYHVNGDLDCGVRINNMEEKDNGEWKCTVTSESYEQGDAPVGVTVAVAPQEVFLRVDGDRVQGDEVQASLAPETDSVEMSVDCVATQVNKCSFFK